MNSRSTDDPAAGLFVTFAGLLIALGTLMVYSSSITARPSEQEQVYLTRQLSFLLATGLAGIAASQLPAAFWRRGAPILFLITAVMMALVLIPGIGREVNGARRWLRLGSFSIQPSETAKLTLPLWLCGLRFDGRRRNRLVDAGLCLGLIASTMFLVLLEPDFGTALFLCLVGCLVLFFTGWPLREFVVAAVLILPAAAMFVALKPYQLARLSGFVATWARPEEAPYQVQQALTTLGVGGLTGTGLGKGWQKLSFLPEANTDFIFAVVGEELGLIGTLGIILLWTGFVVAGRRLIRRIPQGSYESAVATTLLWQLVIQAAVNVAVVTALLPPKGISHPFISYGGSNLVMSVVSVGIIVSLSRLPNAEGIGDN